ncbi:MAG TPA: FkbM family methyltransferase [Vicinamibacterales bacterium]|nr:FkbM family methyltransferase [Vicinamibacterales bacterium]
MSLFIDQSFDPLWRTHPAVLVDVGARGGLRPLWAAMRPHLRLIGFEPDPQEYAQLSRTTADPSTTILPTALHNAPATLPLYIARDRGLTSVFQPNREFVDQFPEASRFDTTDVQEIVAQPLDRVLEAHGIADVDFLKVDTQGSELQILQGAARTLDGGVFGVEVEAEFNPIYRQQPLFADVDAFLRERGFQLFDLRPCYWKRTSGVRLGGPKGQIIWADALYLKTAGSLIDGSRSSSDAAKAKALKAIAISLLYGYADYALTLAHAFSSVLTSDEVALIEDRLRESQSISTAAVPGQALLGKVFQRLARGLHRRDLAWSISAPRLGNERD